MTWSALSPDELLLVGRQQVPPARSPTAVHHLIEQLHEGLRAAPKCWARVGQEGWGGGEGSGGREVARIMVGGNRREKIPS